MEIEIAGLAFCVGMFVGILLGARIIEHNIGEEPRDDD